MKWTDKLARIMAACAVLALLAAAKPANAGSLSADTIALFPKNVGEFAYADLKQARTMKWFPALQEQMLPERFKQFEKFLASAGVDPNTTVEELAWGLVGQSAAKQEGKATVAADVPESEEIVGIALGNFNPDSTEAYFKQQKLATSKSRGYTLFAFGSGVGPSDLFFFFIDSSKAAFGHKQLLEKMIEIRYGGEEGLLANDKLFSLINEVNGSGVVWAVLDASELHSAGDVATCAGSAAVSGSSETRAEHAVHDHSAPRQAAGWRLNSRRFAAHPRMPIP